MSCIYGKGISDFNSLSGQESLMFSAYMLSQFYITQDMFYLALDDAINDDIWSGFRQTSLEILSYPGVQDWLDLRKHWFSEEFQLFLEENMNQSFSGDLVYFDDSNCS